MSLSRLARLIPLGWRLVGWMGWDGMVKRAGFLWCVCAHLRYDVCTFLYNGLDDGMVSYDEHVHMAMLHDLSMMIS